MSEHILFRFVGEDTTYFILLPRDLRVLFSSYYYGPLEIKYEYGNNILKIQKFNSNNKIDVIYRLDAYVNLLFLKYYENPGSGQIGFHTNTIHWKEHFVEIRDTDRISMRLFDYSADLFWEKLRHIVLILVSLKNDGLSKQQITEQFVNYVF